MRGDINIGNIAAAIDALIMAGLAMAFTIFSFWGKITGEFETAVNAEVFFLSQRHGVHQERFFF